MRSKVTSAPAQEPVTLAELKLSLRITSTAQDEFLDQIIIDARQMVERYTSRKLITQTITAYGMPCGEHQEDVWWEGYRRAHMDVISGRCSHFELDHGPAQSIVSIDSIDTSNNEDTYDLSNVYLQNYSMDRMPRIYFNNDSSSPGSLRRQDAWKVVYLAGYGDDPSDVPADIKRALIMLAGYLWNNRGACGDDRSCMEGCGGMGLLDKFVIKYGLS